MPATPDIVQETMDALVKIELSFSFSRMNGSFVNISEKQGSISFLQELIRGNTQIVRNWGHFSQVKSISQELYSYFDNLLFEKVLFRASEVIDVFRYMISSFEKAYDLRFNLLRELYSIKSHKDMVSQYYKIIGQTEEDAKMFIEEICVETLPRKSIVFMLLSHYDLRLCYSYTFDPDSIANNLQIDTRNVSAILETFSLRLGDLSESNIEHIFLDNPVWQKPVIKVDQKSYFCPIPQLFFSFVIESFDSIIEKVDKNALHDRRADYLEQKIEEIVKRRFPRANTVKNIKWKQNGVEYETDLITFIDSYAIIIEAKSGKISDPALRGAPERLKKHIYEILLAPNEQSKRLKDKLCDLIKNPDINDDLREKLPVELEKIHKVLRISVSLEDFAGIQANISRLKDTGWISSDFAPCPTMNLADFEVLFDILEHPVQIVHYLERRAEMEGVIDYIGDERDLLGWYINTLFNFGDLQEENSEIVISGESATLDKYYNSKDQGIILPKPKPQVSHIFRGILEQLEQRGTHRWTEIGAILYRFSPYDQKKLTKMLSKLKREVQKKWMIKGHKNTVIHRPPRSSEYALCYVLYKDENSEKRNDFIGYAAELGLRPNYVKACLVIAKNIDRNDLHYHFIGLFQ